MIGWGIHSAIDSVLCHRLSHLSSIQPSIQTSTALPSLLPSIFHRSTAHLALEKAIEEGDLPETAGQGDIQDAPFAIPKLAAGGLQA